MKFWNLNNDGYECTFQNQLRMKIGYDYSSLFTLIILILRNQLKLLTILFRFNKAERIN